MRPGLKRQQETGGAPGPQRGLGSTDRIADETGVSPGGRHVGRGVPGRLRVVINKVCLNFSRTREAIGVIHVFYKERETSMQVNIFMGRTECSLSAKRLSRPSLLYGQAKDRHSILTLCEPGVPLPLSGLKLFIRHITWKPSGRVYLWAYVLYI